MRISRSNLFILFIIWVVWLDHIPVVHARSMVSKRRTSLVSEQIVSAASLIEAIQLGDRNKVQEFLKTDLHVIETEDRYGRTALMIAADLEYPNPGIVELLLAHIAKLDNRAKVVDARDQNGWTALMLAASNGYMPIVRLLQNYGATAGLAEADLILAINKGDLKNVRAGIQAGDMASIKKDIDNRTLLMLAASAEVESGNIMELLIDHRRDEVNEKTTSGETALMFASSVGHLNSVKTLLDNGAEVNATTLAEETALMSAASYGYFDIVNLLLTKGANVNATTLYKDTALSLASENGHLKIVKLLIDNSARIDNLTANLDPNYIHIEPADLKSIIEALRNKGAEFDAAALQLARAHGYPEVIKKIKDMDNKRDMTPRGNIMPDVVGRSLAQATQELQKMGLYVSIQGSASSWAWVRYQSPLSGTTVSPGSMITLFATEDTRGAGTPSGNAMPNLVGLSIAQAVWELQRRGFPVTIQEYANRALPIVRQQPQAGTVLSPGMAITLFTSAPTDRPGIQGGHSSPSWPLNTGGQTMVPNVSSLSQADAILAIQRAGLVVGRIFTTAAHERSGLVMNQAPQAHTLVPINSIVDLLIVQ